MGGILPISSAASLDIAWKAIIIRIVVSLCAAFIDLVYDLMPRVWIYIGAAYNITELIAFAIKSCWLERMEPLFAILLDKAL